MSSISTSPKHRPRGTADNIGIGWKPAPDWPAKSIGREWRKFAV
jgi:hypothetical protein